MEIEVILGILSAILAGVSAVFAKAWTKIKGKLGKALALLVEATDVVNQGKVISEKAVAALEDDKITAEEIAELKGEIEKLKTELSEVKEAWTELVEK